MIKLIKLLFSPYIWMYKKLIKKEDGNLLDIVEKGFVVNVDDYEDKNIYSSFHEIDLNTKISDIEPQLSKGVIIPLHKLYQQVLKNQREKGRTSLQKMTDIGVNHSINKSLTSDLILYEDRFILKTNTIHGLGNLRKDIEGIDEIELYYKKVSSIQFREGSSILPGTLTFSFPGKTEYKKQNNSGFDVNKKDSDPYILYFFEESNSIIRDVKDFINKKSN